MAKQSKAQKETIERVLHEFKHGDLKSGGRRKVRNPKQAIAIALSEAGASNQQSPAERQQRLRTTKRRERATEHSKAELYAQAKRKNIPGRSKMTKDELARAVSAA